MAACNARSNSGATASTDKTGDSGPNAAVRAGESPNCAPGSAVANMPGGNGAVCGCLLPSALVSMADGSSMRMDELEIGDLVKGFDPGGIPSDQSVIRIIRLRANTLEVTHSLGTTVCSLTHEFMTSEGVRVRADAIEPGTTLLAAADGSSVSVTAVTGREDMIVMAVEVVPDANLIVDGLRHHNKGIMFGG